MTLSEAAKLARRWWWILIVVPLIGGSVAFLVSQLMTPIFRSTTILLIQQSQTSGSQNYQDLLASQQQTGTYSRWITTTPILDAAAKNAGVGGGAEAIKKHVSVSPISDTQLVSVSVTDPSPSRAAGIANSIASVFID